MNQMPMLHNIFSQPASHRAVIDLQQGPQQQTLRECADRIRNARGKLFVSGMGASFFAAMPAASRLAQAGHSVHVTDSAELLHFGGGSFTQGDVAILTSRSGGSVEVVQLAEKMRAAGVTTIAITNVPGSRLDQIADLTLLVGSHADELIAVQSYTGTVLALLLLAEQVLTGDSQQLADACLARLPALNTYIEQTWEQSTFWRDLLVGEGALYIIGRGPALASAHEGALLLHETAKSPAVAMTVGQFRHGPVEVVSTQFRAIVLGTPAVTRMHDRALAVDLQGMGATVRWIGPTPPSSGRENTPVASLGSWPELASDFASLFEVVPMQIAAYRLAEWQGITPGEFRYASEVTLQESGFPLFQARTLCQ